MKQKRNEFATERRFAVDAEMRVDSAGRIEGYAAVFGQWSVDLGGFIEKIRQGAFATAITRDDIRALFNHSADYVLGRNTAGTLELSEDSTGLHFRVDPPATTWVDDLKISIGRGDINQASFGFWTISDEWNRPDDRNKPTERELIECGLYDVSPVTFPAYPQTKIGIRSTEQMIRATLANGNDETIRTLQKILNDVLMPGGTDTDDDDIQQARARLENRRRQLSILEMEI